MSGTASRYQGRLTYGPGLRVASAYPGMTGAELPEIERSQPTPMPQGQTLARSTGATGAGAVSGGDGGSNLLLLAGLGLLPYAGDIFDAASGLFGGEDLPTPPEFLTEDELIRRGMRDAVPAGVSPEQAATHDLGHTFDHTAGGAEAAPGAYLAVPGIAPEFQATHDLGHTFNAAGLDDVAPTAGGGWLGGAQQYMAGLNAPMPGGASQDFGLTGSMGETPLIGGDMATNMASAGGGALGSLISAQNPWTRQRYGGIGQQAGSALGGIGAGALIGSAFGPIGAAFGALGGAFLGGQAGAGIGSQIGPAPTIGRNFGVTGTFGGDGNIHWGAGGGDNGGGPDDANAFANWFGGNLMQRAAAEGLTFNPNMAGVQFNVGGYDQWDRNPNLGGVGGYFYDPYLGGSPERYSLRPTATLPGADLFNALSGPGFTPDQAFGPDQANAFTNAVLGDLSARGVFTRPGQEAPGRDFYQGSMGMPLGSYTPGMSFADAYGRQQGALSGWQAGADMRGQAAAGQAASYAVHNLGLPDPATGMVMGAGGMLTPDIWSPGAE